MKYKYAQIKHLKVLQIVGTDYPMEQLSQGTPEWIDITNMSPEPLTGWIYNRATGNFNPATEESILFQDAKEQAVAAIDLAAGLARKKHTTDITGQDDVYREKYEQAVDFLSSDVQVRYSDYPLLEIESRILNIPVKNIAEIIIKRRSDWMTKIAAIESLRLSGKYNLEHCSNTSEVIKLKSHIVHKITELA